MDFNGRALDLSAWRKLIQELFDVAEGILSEHVLFRRDKHIPQVDLIPSLIIPIDLMLDTTLFEINQKHSKKDDIVL